MDRTTGGRRKSARGFTSQRLYVTFLNILTAVTIAMIPALLYITLHTQRLVAGLYLMLLRPETLSTTDPREEPQPDYLPRDPFSRDGGRPPQFN